MVEKVRAIAEDTLIPISLVLVFVGFVSWFTTLYAETKANGSDISELREDQKRNNAKLDRILEKLGNIEGRLRVRSTHE